MDSNEQKPAWESLVEDLGIRPAPEAFQRHQPPAVELPTSANVAETEPGADLPQRAPSDWKALAGSLGVEIEPEDSPGGEDGSETELSQGAKIPEESFPSQPNEIETGGAGRRWGKQ